MDVLLVDHVGEVRHLYARRRGYRSRSVKIHVVMGDLDRADGTDGASADRSAETGRHLLEESTKRVVVVVIIS